MVLLLISLWTTHRWTILVTMMRRNVDKIRMIADMRVTGDFPSEKRGKSSIKRIFSSSSIQTSVSADGGVVNRRQNGNTGYRLDEWRYPGEHRV